MNRKDSYTKIFLKAAGSTPTDKELEDFKKIFWYSTREKESGGLRLTEQGISWIEEKADIKTYTVELPKELTITAQVIIWMDQYIDTPWFIDKRKLKVLSEKTAFELYLFSGDIKKLGLARTMAKRLSQENSDS